MLTQVQNIPTTFKQLALRSTALGFTMPSDLYVGSLLKTLVASKPNGCFLELGTGMGLSLSWMLAGANGKGSVISIDNDSDLIKEVGEILGNETNLELIIQDGATWIDTYEGTSFDLIFADAWPGKYNHLDETIALLKIGGLYVIDDMLPQENWPEGHAAKAEALVAHLQQREDLTMTSFNWSTGIIVATRVQ